MTSELLNLMAAPSPAPVHVVLDTKLVLRDSA
jgi:hypothetical protein